jgi:hypothetical protein
MRTGGRADANIQKLDRQVVRTMRGVDTLFIVSYIDRAIGHPVDVYVAADSGFVNTREHRSKEMADELAGRSPFL